MGKRMPKVAVGKRTLATGSTRSKKVAASGSSKDRTTAKSVTAKGKNVVPDPGRESPSKEVGRQGDSHGGGEQTSALPGMRTRRRQTAVGSHHLGPSDSVRVTTQEREVNAGRSTSASPHRRDLWHGTEHCEPVGSPYSTQPRQPTSTDGFQPMSTDDCQPTSNRQTSRSTVTVRM